MVMAKYSHREESEEEYIDLVPILENLYIQPEDFRILNLNRPAGTTAKQWLAECIFRLSGIVCTD